MATIIDALIVTLNLDAAKFRQGSNKAKSDLNDLKKSADETRDNFVTLAEAAAGFLAVFTAGRGIEEFTKNITASNTQIERLSKNVGVAAADIQAWGQASAKSGGSAEAFQGTLSSLSREMTEIATTGQSQSLPYYRALGVQWGDAQGRARPFLDILHDVSTALAKLPRPTANNIGLKIGIDQGTLNAMLEGPKALQAYLDKVKRLNPVTKEQIEQSKELTDATNDFSLASEGLGRSLVSIVTPALTKFFEILTNVFAWLRVHRAIVAGIALAIGAVLAPALWGAAAAAWALIAPLVAISLPILAAIAALALLADDLDNFFHGRASFTGDIWKAWTDLWGEIAHSGDFVKAAIRAALGGSVGAFEGALSGFAKGGVFGALVGAGVGFEKGAIKGLKQGNAADQNKAVSFFEAQGWTHEQASGIVANLVSESSLNPQATGDGGKAYGIAQWHPDRQAAFQKQFGKPIWKSTQQEQLAFVNYELTQGAEQDAGRRLRATTTADAAGRVGSNYYERPADVYGEALKRGNLASLIATQNAAAQPANYVTRSATSNSSSAETHIGTINVHTAATDANGVAAGLHEAISRNNLANQADYGVN